MKYGILDIGSNTVVLALYEIQGTTPVNVGYYSEPVHLVSYNNNGHMADEGIQKTVEILKQYRLILANEGVEQCGAFITEPIRRIDNADDVLRQFNSTGFTIQPLTGREEAEYDFYGTRIDCIDVMEGNAFDIGGGSTELISFSDGKIVEAVSMPMGCVRLASLPIEKELTDAYIRETLIANPNLNSVKSKQLIGIGGTCRAAMNMCSHLYGVENQFSYSQLLSVYEKLLCEDPEMVALRNSLIDAGRINVFLPGVNMLLSIMRCYEAETVRFSQGSVREGYLLHCLNLV